MQKKYRVFDRKDNFQQSYDAALEGGFSWARDCAKNIGGYVKEYTFEDFSTDQEGKVILDFRQPK